MMGFASCKRAHQRVALIALISSPQQSMTPCVVLTPLRVSQAVSQLMETKQAHKRMNIYKRNMFLNHSLNVRMMYFLHQFVFPRILFVPLSRVHYPVERKQKLLV